MRPISVIVETTEAAATWSAECNRRAAQIIAEGKPALLQVSEAEDVRSLRQNAFYWGPMLQDISEQAKIGGQRYTKDMWHEFGKREFLPRTIKRTRVAGRKSPVVTRSIGSTSGLSVRKMSAYLERFMAYAVTDLGVKFSEHRWEDYRQ